MSQKPQVQAPTDRQKERAKVVYATSPDGRIFKIPEDQADQFQVSADRLKELCCVAVVPPGIDQGEVGGRHRPPIHDGRPTYHSNWIYGSYLWITDGSWYNGYHWHPNPEHPGAYDVDD